MTDAITSRFRERFGSEPRLFRAPGRINIIGEHTDYSGGLVMPAAIDRYCVVAAASNGARRLRVASQGFTDAEVDLDALVRGGDWVDYVTGVASVLTREGMSVPGADILIESAIPIGAGISSSAALEVAVAQALLALARHSADGLQVARWSQEAENDFVGMPCGIMDQFAAANGVADSALLLDCSTLQVETVRLPKGARFLLIDSMVRHSHVDSEYRSRREDCETAAHILGLPRLSALDQRDLADALPRLPERVGKRARHVVSENARVRAAAAAMKSAKLPTLGALMTQSHSSLRDDMEVSVPEVDTLAAIAQQTKGVFGARLMGGGFGGSVIVLAKAEEADKALASIRAAYAEATGKQPNGFACKAVAGAGEVLP